MTDMTKKQVLVTYTSNNSGGDWWLHDDDWRFLEEAGWAVDWYAGHKDGDSPSMKPDKDGRWLGALATSASKKFSSIKKGVEDWESVVGMSSTELGCGCCGPPHGFSDDAYNYYSPEALYGNHYDD